MKKLLFTFYCWNIMGSRSGWWGKVYNMALSVYITASGSASQVFGSADSASGSLHVYAYSAKNYNIVNRYILEKKTNGFITVPNGYLNMYPFRYEEITEERDKGIPTITKTGHLLPIIDYKGSSVDNVSTIPMPTVDVSKIGNYGRKEPIFEVYVKGDKWNEDEVIKIKLIIMYERRASHRNYYNGGDSLVDKVIYYEGNDSNLEYEGKQKSWSEASNYSGNEFMFIYGNGYE